MCKIIGLPYSTLTNQISNNLIPPKLEQIAAMAEFLNISLDELVYGEDRSPIVTPEALAVERSPRLRKIVFVLQGSPEKLDALETFLDIRHIPSDGTKKPMGAQK